MSNENAEYQKLMTEFEQVCKQLDDVLKDIEWRKPDVEAEEAKLRELTEKAKDDPLVDVASQAVVVRVLREVLDDKIAEAERLEARMLELKAQFEVVTTAKPTEREAGESGQAVRETP